MKQDEIIEVFKSKFPQITCEGTTKAVIIDKSLLLEVASFLKNSELAFDNLHCITAIDLIDRLEVVYIFCSVAKRHTLTVKVYLTPDALEIESLTNLWKSADWFEREVYDLFGIRFLNHPDLRRILTPADWQVHPLRKNFSDSGFMKRPRN